MAQTVKNMPAMQETRVQSGLGRSPGEGNVYPLRYSHLVNSIDRGAWQAIVHGVAELDMTEHVYTLSLKVLRSGHFFLFFFCPPPPGGLAGS